MGSLGSGSKRLLSGQSKDAGGRKTDMQAKIESLGSSSWFKAYLGYLAFRVRKSSSFMFRIRGFRSKGAGFEVVRVCD